MAIVGVKGLIMTTSLIQQLVLAFAIKRLRDKFNTLQYNDISDNKYIAPMCRNDMFHLMSKMTGFQQVLTDLSVCDHCVFGNH